MRRMRSLGRPTCTVCRLIGRRASHGGRTYLDRHDDAEYWPDRVTVLFAADESTATERHPIQLCPRHAEGAEAIARRPTVHHPYLDPDWSPTHVVRATVEFADRKGRYRYSDLEIVPYPE